eukprot:11342679-Ditylum_brightwellii.AAC.1
MGHYHIELTTDASKLYTIALHQGKYEYCNLPIGLCNSPDIFQENMDEFFAGFEATAYIDDSLLMANGTYEEHLEKLDK